MQPQACVPRPERELKRWRFGTLKTSQRNCTLCPSPRHPKTLVQCHVERGEAVAADYVPRACLTGIGMHERRPSGIGIGEGANRTGNGITVMSHLRTRDHLSDALLVPVGRPEVTVVHSEREAAGPTGYTGKLPATDNGFTNRAR